MSRKPLFTLSIVVLLSILRGVVFAEVMLSSETVSYTASKSLSHTGPIGQISFDVTVNLTCEVTYSAAADGVLPPSSTVHLNVTPNSATLSGNYHIERPLLPDKDGDWSIPLPQDILSGLLGDSQPIEIPIGAIGTIEIIIHGQLTGDLSPDNGAADPTTLEWSTWAAQDTVVSASVDTVTLTMDTAYRVSFTVTVSIIGFNPVTKEVNVGEVSGEPSPTFVIPEFPSLLILPLFVILTLLVIFIGKRMRALTRNRTLAFK